MDKGIDTVGWLRFVELRGGGYICAGLFETSVQGEPLGFSFTQGECCKSGTDRLLTDLAGPLFGSRMTAVSLLFGLAEEISPQAFGALNPGVPACRVHPEPVTRDGAVAARKPQAHSRMAWATGVPLPESAAGRIFGQIMRQDNPFEPFERAAIGLTEAFADPQVRDVAGTGLRTVVVLPPIPVERQEDNGVPSLIERLWTALAVPRADLPSGPANVRLEWPANLLPFQRDGVRALVEMDRLLLSDDMGLGKTVQAVAAIRILKARDDIGSCLVVAPAGVLDQWRRELSHWAKDLTAIIVRGGAGDRGWQWRAQKDVKLVSYDVLRQDAGFLGKSGAFRDAWGLVVLDEAQRIKNRNDTSEAAKGIPRQRSWALTGTPLENDEEELASIMEFVDHDEGTPRRRYRPGAALRSRHRDLQLRRKKNDVLRDLPPKLETRLTISLHRDQRKSYEEAERDGIVFLKSLGAEVGIQHILELITRLKQICNVDPRTGASSKLDDIADRLGTLTAQGHRALIFSQYASSTSGVAAAANHLRAFNPLTLTGEIPVDQRSELINRFKAGTRHKALIISLRAGGVGLNLQDASYVFHLDRWWNPAVERQAEDRSHRMGQTVKVNVIKYTCEGTIEERIDQVLQEKQTLFDQLVDDVSMELSTRMNRKELLGFFGLD